MVSTSGSSGMRRARFAVRALRDATAVRRLASTNAGTQAAWAAACSASFLDRPSPRRRTVPPRAPWPGTAGRDRDRPLDLVPGQLPDRRSDHLLQAGLEVLGARARRPPARCGRRGGRARPVATSRSRRRGRPRRSPPRRRWPGSTAWPGRRTTSSPRPRRRARPEVELLSHLGQHRRVDHRRPAPWPARPRAGRDRPGSSVRRRPGRARRRPGTRGARWTGVHRLRRTTTGGTAPGRAGPRRGTVAPAIGAAPSDPRSATGDRVGLRSTASTRPPVPCPTGSEPAGALTSASGAPGAVHWPAGSSAVSARSELGDHVVDGVPHGPEVLEVLVLDAETRPSARRAPPRAPRPARSGPASRRRGPRRTRTTR